jgi:predicted dehydrogenase
MTQRLFLIGAGVIARAHAGAARALPDIELHVADPSREALATFADSYPEAMLYGDADEMLAIPAAEDDIVIVAVPPWLHAPMTIKGFASGRHVLCEKPLGRDLAELDSMLAAAHQAGKLLGDCSVRFLGQPQLVRAREILDSGQLGKLYHANLINRRTRSRPGVEYQPASRWFLHKEKSGGGALLDWGVYDLATFFDVVRPIKVVVQTAWTAAPSTALDPKDSPFDVESHAGANLLVTLKGGDTFSLTYERGNGLHGEERDIMELDGATAGISWNWVPWQSDRVMSVTVHADAEGRVVATTEKFTLGARDIWHDTPLHSFVDLIAVRPSLALDEDRLRFNFACIAAIYDVAASGVPKTIELT